MVATKTEPRSPIKEPLPRLPGQSGQEKLDETVTYVMAWVTVGLFAVIVAGLEWARWAFAFHDDFCHHGETVGAVVERSNYHGSSSKWCSHRGAGGKNDDLQAEVREVRRCLA